MTSEHTARTVRVGAVIFAALLLLGGMLFLAGNFHLFDDGYQLHVVFNYARGIDIGAPVLVAGVRLGNVEDIGFVTINEISRPRLTLWLSRKAEIRGDSKIYIKSLGLMGQSAIEFTPGSPDAEIVQPGATLHGEEPFVADEVLAQARDVVTGLSKAVSLFNSVLEEAGAKQRLRESIEDFSEATAQVNSLLTRNADRVDSIAISVERTANRLDRLTDDQQDEIKATIQALKETSDHLKGFSSRSLPIAHTSLENMNKLTARLNELLKLAESDKSVAGVILSDPNSAKRVQKILKNVEEFSEDVRKHPWKLMRKP